MSRGSLYELANELRPYIEGKATIMRGPVDVVKTSSGYTLLLERRGPAYGKRQMPLDYRVKLCPTSSVKYAKPLLFTLELSISNFLSLNQRSRVL